MNDQAFEEAIESHRRAVLAYAFTCSRDMAAAEDIVQETCVTAYRKRDSYNPDASFRAWLMAIACFVWLRECDKRGVRARAMQYIHDNADTLFTPEIYNEDRWGVEKAALKKCLAKLPRSDRNMIEAHFVQCWKYARIAKHLQRTTTWVKVRMYRLRQMLRSCVSSNLNGNGTETI